MDILLELKKAGVEIEPTLERFMDDKDMYVKYIKNFPTEQTMTALVNAVNVKDYTAAEHAVHAFKGVVGNLGFVPLADAAIDMLEELRDGNIELALEAYEEVEKEYAKFCRIINIWKNQA